MGKTLLFAALWLLTAASCFRNSHDAFTPPPTPPLTRDVIGFGVIDVTYIQVLAEPNPGGLSLGYLRRGDIVRIWERRMASFEGAMEPWLFAAGEENRGWLRESSIQVYDNEAQAKTAAERLLP